MKANFEQIETLPDSSFTFKYYKQAISDAISLHFHPDYEITCIMKGNGRRIVGERVDTFKEGDLIFVGPNVPHCWLYAPSEESEGEEKGEDDETGQIIENMVIQFKEDHILSCLQKAPELSEIHHMLKNLRGGFILNGNTKLYVMNKMLSIPKASHYKKFVIWLDILNRIATCADSIPIDTMMNSGNLPSTDIAKFQKVYNYVNEHYTENITLSEIAEVVHMSTTVFCRFFKKVTNKTFLEFLSTYRIEEACRLLRETEMSVLDISYACGFNDVPHFNRMFKRHTEYTPMRYRQMYT